MTRQNLNQSDLNFTPHPLARNCHFQTIVSSFHHQNDGALQQATQQMILDTGDGVRLQGYYSPQPEDRSRGVVLLLHGWLGSANSNYVLTIREYLYRRGYAIFRLNLRDHGDTHQLNPAPFRSDLLDEVFTATRQIAQLEAGRPLHLIGASLGGNFALRLAWRHSQSPLPNLNHTVAICPVLNPHHTTLQLDQGYRLYLAYFRRKWRRSLRQKQALFPHRYDFSAEISAPTCMEMTEIFVRNHSPYPDALTYFQKYTVTPAMMATLRSPTTMLPAIDDPIVPVADFGPFAELESTASLLRVRVQPYGGHVGFIDILPFRSWLGEAALTILES